MKNLKILSYQRNGVAGNGFYVATCTEFGKEFVVTFNTLDGFENKVDVTSCRAVCLSDLAEKWRGDDFAWEMNRIIEQRLWKLCDKEKTSPLSTWTIYDLIEKKPRKVVHHIDGNPRNSDPANLRMIDLTDNR